MLLNQLFAPKKLFEGGNLASHKADGQPMPGWQGVPGQHQAQELDLNVHNRTEVVAVLSDLLHSINDLFAQQFKEPLWHENSVKAQKFLSGSTMRFFDKKIPDEEFVRVKPTVGDIDTQAPDKHEGTIKQFLTGLIGKQVGDAKFIGFSAGNNQYTSMWQVTLQDMPVKLQIDFEYGAHDPETGLPTPWQEYSHSSSWEDLSAGIKGVFHKYIDRALPYASTVSTKYVARVLKKSTKISDEPVTDSDYSFAVSGQGGGGVSRKYVPYNDPSTGAPMEKDGIPVMQLLDPANRQYIQNLGQQFEIFFGRKPKGNDQQLKNSFVGTVELANKYLDDQQRTELFNRFVSICFEPGSQMITKGDPVRDRTIKMAAIDYMIQNMKLSNPQAMRKQAIKTAMDYEQAFTSKQAGKGVTENDTAAGINMAFNNLGDPVYSNLQRVALLAMQGRQQEAAGRLQTVIKDASPKVQKKITDAVNNIKPVTINGKIADSSTLDKSKQHQEWILKTFIPWVRSLLDKQDVTEAEVKAQFRKNMPHLKDLKPIDFLDLLDELDQGDGKFKLKNIPLNVKVDGFGGRFGKNSEGKPFMATSRTEPRYQAGFVDYHQKKGTTDPEILGRAQLFDDLFKEMMTAVEMVDSKLGPDFLVNKQVTCEVLYLPFATETPEGKLKFVGIHYDKLPQGVELALVPFRVTDATTGEDLPDSNKIVKALTGVGRQGSVMFIDNSLTQNDELDVTEIINVLDNIEELKQIVSDTAGKRDRASLELRKQVEEKLQPVKVELEKAIINDPNIIGKDLLGKDYEGIVINSRLGPIKITSQEQRDVISAKNAAKVSARTERPRGEAKTAVVAIGSFIGHKGHEELWNYTVNKAKEVGGDPYLFIGNAEGKDDPIPPAVKVQTWHKLYPEYAKNISTVQEGGQLIQKIKHELINPLPGKPPRYDNIIIMVGEDRAGINMPTALMKAVNKFQGYEHVKVSLGVTPRGTGISGTALRNSLKNDPPEKALATWSNAFDVNKLGVDWIKHLMNITRKGMGIQMTQPPAQQPAAQPAPIAEMRLFNALMAPKYTLDEGQLELNTPNPVVVVQDLKGNILDTLNLSIAAQKYKLGQPQNIKNQLAHQSYTKIGNYTISAPMGGQPQDQTTLGKKNTFATVEGGIATVSWDDDSSRPSKQPPVSVGGTFDARPVVKRGSLVKASGLSGVYRVMDILRDEAKIVQEIPNTGQSTYVPMSDLRVWTNKPIREKGVAEDWKNKVAAAGLAGAMALGGTGVAAQSSGEDYLPDIVAHVKFKVNGKEISKDINLGTQYKSPREAAEGLEKFLKSKGIKYYEYDLERVKPKDDDFLDKGPYTQPIDKSNNFMDKRPAADLDGKGDYMSKESVEEAMSASERMQRALQREKEKREFSQRYAEKHFPIGKKPESKPEEKKTEMMDPSKFAGYPKNKLGSEAHLKGTTRRGARAGDLVGETDKIKGADGKACWPGYRYNGTENGSDKCVKIGEAWEIEMSHAISKLFENK